MEQGPPINRQDIRQQAFDQKMICSSITPLVDACRPQVPCFSLVYYILFLARHHHPALWRKEHVCPDSNKNLGILWPPSLLYHRRRREGRRFFCNGFILCRILYIANFDNLYKKFKLKRAPLSSDWFRMSDWQLLRWWSECKKRNLPKRTLAIKLLECNFFFIISVLLFSTSALQLAFQWR